VEFPPHHASTTNWNKIPSLNLDVAILVRLSQCSLHKNIGVPCGLWSSLPSRSKSQNPSKHATPKCKENTSPLEANISSSPLHQSSQPIFRKHPSQLPQTPSLATFSTKLISPPRPPLPIHLHNPARDSLNTRLITSRLLLLWWWRRRPLRARVPRDVEALS